MLSLRQNLRLSLRGSSAAVLSLDFLSATSLDARITFTRGSSATRVNSSGVIVTASTNVARFDYDPVTLAAKGLLIEEARTNLLTYSEQFDNAAWGKTDVTVTANNTSSPDGTTSADLLTEGVAGTAAIVQTATVTVANPITFTVYAKRGNADWLQVQLGGSGTERLRGWFDLAAGTAGSVANVAPATGAAASIQNAGNGWYRCVLSGTLAGAGSTCIVNMFCASADASLTRVNNATRYSWGAQLEAGAFATSYIPTVASTVTRSADVATMTGTNFSSWYNQSAGTFVVQADSPASGTRAVISADDNTANERINFYTTTLDPKMLIVDGGITQADIDAGSITANTAFKLGGAFKLNDTAVSVGGGAEVTDVVVTIPTVDRLRIGADQAGNYLNGHVKNVTFYNTRRSLQALTA